ncbi:hypothetical protein [Pararhizobium sp. LjRoot238]|uniref:hypothetical protein n=1 Tax=Pararhizobium sp. LjRoot238 TaxID=3342293 RepID=UPI003ECD2909
MGNPEQAVRDAAERLHDAILDARASGLSVVWPHRPGDLLAISISETGKFSGSSVVSEAQIGEATGIPLTGVTVPADGVMREVAVDSATDGRRPKK